MAISRPLLLALIGAVLAAATLFVATNARDVSTTSSTAVVPAAGTSKAAAAQPAAAKLSAKEALAAAVESPGLKSARAEGSLRLSGASDQAIDFSGRFQLAGPTDMPRFDAQFEASGDAQDMKFGFVSTGDEAYVVQGDDAYAVPDEVWSQAVQARAGQGSAQAAATPAALGLDPSKWVRDVKDEGTDQVDGVETRHVSATIDAGAALRDVSKLAPGSTALPPGAAASVEDAKLEAWVGTDDNIVRRLTAEVEAGGERVKLDFSLSEVNDPQTIEAPADAKELPAGVLGGAAPIFTQGLSLATGASPKALELAANDNPQRLNRAVGDHREVVLFFHQQRGLDDQATAEAVRTLDRRTRVLVLSDDVRNADRYGKLVEDLGVSQAPSIVIVDREGKARLIEGYVDADSLVQEVSDAR